MLFVLVPSNGGEEGIVGIGCEFLAARIGEFYLVAGVEVYLQGLHELHDEVIGGLAQGPTVVADAVEGGGVGAELNHKDLLGGHGR